MTKAGCCTNLSTKSKVAIVLSAVVVCVGVGVGVYFAASAGGGWPTPDLLGGFKKAAPQGFVNSAGSLAKRSNGCQDPSAAPGCFSVNDLVDRFFSSNGGPTNIWQLVKNVDTKLKEYAGKSATSTCARGNPKSYDLKWPGETVAIRGQCKEGNNNPLPYFRQVAFTNDTFEMYDVGGSYSSGRMSIQASKTKLKPDGTIDSVDIWGSVVHTDYSGSHGIFRVTAYPDTKKFEMTAAGTGLGFCGAHLISDGTNIYLKGSSDMGQSCGAIYALCADATALTSVTVGSCTVSATNFKLPDIGRIGVSNIGTSAYPGGSGNNVKLDGADASVFFGPTECCTPGVVNW